MERKIDGEIFSTNLDTFVKHITKNVDLYIHYLKDGTPIYFIHVFPIGANTFMSEEQILILTYRQKDFLEKMVKQDYYIAKDEDEYNFLIYKFKSLIREIYNLEYNKGVYNVIQII